MPGGGGLGRLSIPRIDAGTETPVTAGACGTASNKSANGFKNTLAAHNVATQFDFRGDNAFESDFKDPANGGHDSTYVDDVDIQWYSGHDGPGGFTFNGFHDDQVITPDEARWGDRDLEWLQLESREVLKDTTGTSDYFKRWGKAFKGLHILSGFHTAATCSTKLGLGRDFADGLFPSASHPVLTVLQAWVAAAIKNEPAGTISRSMGPLQRFGNIYLGNYGDYFWGQNGPNPVGPDIPMPDGFLVVHQHGLAAVPAGVGGIPLPGAAHTRLRTATRLPVPRQVQTWWKGTRPRCRRTSTGTAASHTAGS